MGPRLDRQDGTSLVPKTKENCHSLNVGQIYDPKPASISMAEPDARMIGEVAFVDVGAWLGEIRCHTMDKARLIGVIMCLQSIWGFIEKERRWLGHQTTYTMISDKSQTIVSSSCNLRYALPLPIHRRLLYLLLNLGSACRLMGTDEQHAAFGHEDTSYLSNV